MDLFNSQRERENLASRARERERENILKAIMILKLAAKNGGRKSSVFRLFVLIG